LSVAVPAAAWFLKNIDVMRVANSVDFMKVMSYDFAGSWSKNTSHHTDFYQNKLDPDGGVGGWSADQAMNLYIDAGVSPSKLLLGSAFNGRAWQGVTTNNGGLS
jgi:chitinase